ncbi:hypothetical protein CoNPh4_CDS0080 [Staphylococcus phage S-CoN_Ph4]|nr:hypothetical protein CoNPh4_CDS0080 [Staphylococcus phage S-CoN_Ph4]WNM52299.1 hypothetical protein CoNPh6_CDS0089 [Staphylococcus phage S-CoN_Ph6]WNM52638.1 hypothetical protein CoNPh8_CDS0084 [Staphylococcus phage S-CoN_Ph8]WNM52807.1 hypothetical protein CoNPh9_CDS0078 [Staphylococcus phage S-CoN_Ph9]WNM55949.1 hypothetical protein CoNPh38_CDS0073 [Staphylococcus phage S-CoN_Ph38]
MILYILFSLHNFYYSHVLSHQQKILLLSH